MTKKSKILDWYQAERNRDNIELQNEKKEFINLIKKVSKEDILPKKSEKLSLWKRIKKVLMG